MTYRAFHRWYRRGTLIEVDVVGCETQEEAQREIIKTLKRHQYRLPRWWEFWREPVPEWIKKGFAG